MSLLSELPNNEDMDLEYIGRDDMDCSCISLDDDMDFKCIGLDDDMDFEYIGLDDDMAGPEETKPERIASVRNLRDQADNGHMDFRCIGLGEELEFEYIDQDGEMDFNYIGPDDDMDFKCVGLENDPACPSDRGWQRQVSGGTLA
jgi:hypothetical protein